jgi:WD40 repeat protein
LVASASYDHTVRLWDLTRPQNEEVILPNEAVVMNVAFSPDGGLLVAPCADGVVRIWDVRMRTLLRTYQGHPHNGNVFAVAFHPTERYIATGGRLGQAVRLWDPATGQDLRTLPWAASVRSLAFSADGKLLAAASYEGVVKVWDATPGGAELSTHHLYAGAVLSLAFSPDGSKLVWCTSTGRVQIIEPRTGAEVRTLRGHDGAVLGVAFSPDGRRLATAGGDRRVRVWDADAPQEVRSFGKEGGWNYGCAFSPDAHYVALAGGISQSNKGAGHRSVRLWDLEGRRLVKEFAAPDYLTSVAYGPGGDQLAAGSEDGTALLWDVATAAVRHELKGHSGVVTGIAYSPDGRDLATAGADGTVRLWDTATGKEARRFLEDGDPVTGVAYSPDGRLVAASISDGTVRLWNAATEREVHTLRGHDKAVTCVVFSPDSKWLASTGLDLTVRLWDVHTGKETRPRNEPLRLGGPAPEEKRKPWDRTRPLVPHLAFSADGRRLASINGIQPVQLWDVATGLEVLTLPVQESGFLCLAFGPDGRRLVAAAGGWVHVWDADTARLLTR